MTDAISVHGLRKSYGNGSSAVTALDDVSAAFPACTFTAIMGPSGSGKSSFLQCAAGLDRPDAGSVRVTAAGGAQIELTGLAEPRATRLRRELIGFVFQSFNLLPMLDAEQNVALPLRLAGRAVDRGAVREALAVVGLAGRHRHRPHELSGGQQQRVALARALVASPPVLFADEPTGALDTVTGVQVMRLLRSIVDTHGRTVVMVTHDPKAAAYADRVLFLADGRIVAWDDAPTPEAVAARLARLEVPASC